MHGVSDPEKISLDGETAQETREKLREMGFDEGEISLYHIAYCS